MRAWWQQREPRERGLLTGLAGLVLLVLLWLLVWEPLASARATQRAQLASQMALLDWLERAAPQLAQVTSQVHRERSLEGRSPMAVVDQSARNAGLAGALRRIEPEGERAVRVELEQAAFSDLMQWLAALLAERPLVVERFDADRAEPGRVNCTLVLRHMET